MLEYILLQPWSHRNSYEATEFWFICELSYFSKHTNIIFGILYLTLYYEVILAVGMRAGRNF